MVNVQFEEQYTQTSSQKRQPSGIIGFLITKGIVKDIRQANMLLLGAIVVLVLISIFSLSTLPNNSEQTEFEIDPDLYIEE